MWCDSHPPPTTRLGHELHTYRHFTGDISTYRSFVNTLNRRHECLLHEEPTREAMCVWRNVVACACQQCCHGRATSILYSEYVSVTLLIQHAMRMLRVISSVACLTLTFLSTFSHNSMIFGKKCYKTYKVCSDFHHNFFLKHFSL